MGIMRVEISSGWAQSSGASPELHVILMTFPLTYDFFHIMQACQLPMCVLFTPPWFYFSLLKFALLIERCCCFFHIHPGRLIPSKSPAVSGHLNGVFKAAFDGKDAKSCALRQLFGASLWAAWLRAAELWYPLWLCSFGEWDLKYIIPLAVHLLKPLRER